MFDENNNEERPRFDSVTGQPIIYNDEVESKAGDAAQTDTTQINNTPINNTEMNDNSTQYRYTRNDIPFMREENNANSMNSQTAGVYNAEKEPKAKKPKKRGLIRKTVGFVAAAAIFGVIAGSTAYGVYYAEGQAFPLSGNTTIEIPTVSTGISNTTSNVISESGDDTSTTMNVSQVVKAAMPAIVAINGTVTTTSNYYYPYATESSTSGTGIIVGKNDTELLIVTNAHVVDGVNNLSVVFADDESVSATVKGSKSDKDVAVIAVTLSDIKASTLGNISIAELGDSDDVEIGEQVVAIGNALGEGQSATVGWISALNRSITVDNVVYSNLFMTDAAINPGNSGGALLNAKGQVIGINSAKYASEEVEAMGYAIPISSVKDIIDNLMNRQTRTKVDDSKASYLGISGIDITSSISSTYGYPQGIMIQQVVSGTAAEAAGLVKNDIIVSFDDVSITSFDTLKSTMQYYASGEKVVIEYYHMESGEYQLKSTEVTLGHNSSTTK